MATQVADGLESAGTNAYAWELMKVSQRAVELQFGPGTVSRIERLGRGFWMIGSQAMVDENEPGKGPRHLSLCLDGLEPEQPFHDIEDHPWCRELSGHAASIMEELRLHEGSSLWKDMGDSRMLALEWRSITVVKHGLW